VQPERAIRRNAARPGDAIVVTGVHGNARAGLELLLHPDRGQDLTAGERSHLIRAHQQPQPRLDVLPPLEQVMKSTPWAVAGMDSSDGLADAIIQICRASQVGAIVDRQRLPIDPILQKMVPPVQVLDWVLYGGEDFELVLCLPHKLAQALIQHLGNAAMIIGEIKPGSEVLMTDSLNPTESIPLRMEQGFQHFGS
jgi:thiamine-monophosphate kinase